MASYLPNIPEYIPQVQPFTPDYNFYGNALSITQAKADNARKQLGSLYGSLLNAPLTRQDTTDSRDAFFKVIEQDITRMAGMDLSLDQNVNAARTVFDQLLENKSIVHDMVWTKKHHEQLKRSEGFKNCIDPDKCGGSWWDGGDRLLQYDRLAYQNASPQEALNAQAKEFVPYQDITKMAVELADKAGLSIEMDQLTGGWITTTKNGPALIGPLQQLFLGSIAKDPKVLNYYKAQAELQRKDFIYGQQNFLGGLDAAENAYVNQMTPVVESLLEGVSSSLEEASSNNMQKKEKVEKAQEKATPREETYLQELVNEFHNRQVYFDDSKEEFKKTSAEARIARAKGKYESFQIDNILAMATLSQDIGQQAATLAFRDFKQSIKVNPYSLEAIQFKNRMLLEEFRFRNDAQLEMLKDSLGGGGTGKGKKHGGVESAEAQGPPEANIPVTVQDIPGGVAVGDSNTASDAYKERNFTSFIKDRDVMRYDVSLNEKHLIGQALNLAGTAADNGDVQAKEDYVSMIKSLVASKDAGGSQVGIPKEQLDANGRRVGANTVYNLNSYEALSTKLNSAMTVDEAYSYARHLGSYLKIDEMDGTNLDILYNKSVSKMLDPTVQGNKVLRDYLSPMRDSPKTIAAQRSINAKMMTLSNMDKWYAEESKQVAMASAGVSEFGKDWSEAFKAYLDSKGHVVDENTFVNNMLQKGYPPHVSRLIYSGDNKEHEGIHQKWKRAFTQLSQPSGDRSVFGLSGAADKVAMGARYTMVDPENYRSVAMLGTTSFLRDALADPNTVYDMGGFKDNLSNANQEAAQKIVSTLYSDLQTMTSEDRPILNVTYADIAGGREDKVALNITLNENYRKNYKGSGKDPGIMSNPDLVNKGVTIYLDKNKTNNLFTQGAKETDVEKTMKWTGRLDFNQYPDYVKDFKVVSDPQTSQYVVSGNLMKGYTDKNMPIWTYVEQRHDFNVDLNDLVNQYDNLLRTVASKNSAFERNWVLQNK